MCRGPAAVVRRMGGGIPLDIPGEGIERKFHTSVLIIEQASLCTAAPGFWTNSGHCAASVCNMVLGLHKNGRVFNKE